MCLEAQLRLDLKLKFFRIFLISVADEKCSFLISVALNITGSPVLYFPISTDGTWEKE